MQLGFLTDVSTYAVTSSKVPLRLVSAALSISRNTWMPIELWEGRSKRMTLMISRLLLVSKRNSRRIEMEHCG